MKLEKSEITVKRGHMMKRYLTVLSLLLTALLLFSCQGNTETPFTANDAVAVFEDDLYLKQNYGDNMISPVRESIEADAGREIEIVAIIHVINQETSVPNLEWTYIYEFSKKEDADWFEENRNAYVATQEGGRCIRFDNVVVFGNSPLIDTIGK